MISLICGIKKYNKKEVGSQIKRTNQWLWGQAVGCEVGDTNFWV